MNILFVTEDHSTGNYGVTTVVSQLANEITGRGNDNRVIIVAVGRDTVKQNETVSIELLNPTDRLAFWGWSPNLINRLNNIVTRYHIDIIHIHGVWRAVQWAALQVARKREIPCIVTSHGMLRPWFWNKQSLWKKYKKKLYFKLFLQPAITTNTILHAITVIEKNDLERLLPGRKIIVIPNAISLQRKNDENFVDGISTPEKAFLFLGRIHPVKGVDLLINAFAQANLGNDWRLVLAGPEFVPQYVKKLKATVLNKDLSDRIEFTGPIFGEEKHELIRKSWAVVIPSYSEAMSMVNLEAAIYKVPSITTFETGLWDWEEGGGILIHPNVNELVSSLLRVSHWSLDERLDYGNKSYQLVAKKYSWENVLPQWEALYSSLLTNHD